MNKRIIIWILVFVTTRVLIRQYLLSRGHGIPDFGDSHHIPTHPFSP